MWILNEEFGMMSLEDGKQGGIKTRHVGVEEGGASVNPNSKSVL